MTVSFPGSDVLFAPTNSGRVASSTPAQSNPYQQTYDAIASWSDTYLLQSAEYGAPQVPQYTAGGTASSFAQLTTLLGQISTGVQQGLYGQGGSSINTLA